ncbi:MAG: hypothetical protein IT204_13470 [Fimbriimonadaceae bacterium]|nr:hypothetical protein [Fimbriimonadaceae bacterium]
MRRTVLLLSLLGASAAPGEVLFIEPEQFAWQGDWRVQQGEPNALSAVLISTVEQAARPAVGAVQVPVAGAWRLLVRARDFPRDRPGTRRFAVEVNGRRSPVEFGAHGNPDDGAQGWKWEEGGSFELPAGPAVLALRPVTPFCRCDSLALVRGTADVPRSVAAALAARTALLPLEASAAQLQPLPAALVPAGQVPQASLPTPDGELRFQATAAGIVLQTATGACSLERYRVLEAPPEVVLKSNGGSSGQWPTWEPFTPQPAEVGLGAVRYHSARGNAQWLPLVGREQWLVPRAARRDGDRVILTAAGDVGEVTATWSVPPGGRRPALELRFTPRRAGSYGLGYGVGPASSADTVREVLCPYLWQFRRLPTEPKLTSIESCSTPLALLNQGGNTWGLAVDPANLSTAWPDVRQMESGFTLTELDGRHRVTLWDPLPGGRGAQLAAGQPAVLRARLLTAGDQPLVTVWEQAAREIYGYRDYRQNVRLSLTEATLNAIDLLRDPVAGGWSDDGLGPWNIEGSECVTQASPLGILSAAQITGDPDLLANRAIPSLAYLLSRPTTHFSTTPAGGQRLGLPRLGGPLPLYGAVTRGGALAATHGYAPAFAALLTDAAGNPARTAGYGKVQPFDDALAAWQATADERYRQQAIAALQAYLDWPQRQSVEIDPNHFYQLSFSGNWEGLATAATLLDDPAARAAAVALARTMVSGLLTWPAVVAGDLTVHRGGQFEGNGILWWRGADWFTLGVPLPKPADQIKTWQDQILAPVALPEQRVPGWIPSLVGLGIEQPTTYRRLRSPQAAIMMASWAPALLRLGDPLLTTAAHNAVLGRWGNYPGYYATDYTDQFLRADYPLQGPDVSGIYYHHIPPHIALCLDYLVSDVEVRSAGQVRFPTVRQCGYAWFDNRLVGHAPGSVYGTPGVWPWLRRGLVTLSDVRLNWLAGHTAETVFVMLTNTSDEAVRSTVRLDPAVTGGAAGPVHSVGPAGGELPLTAGAVTVTVPPQGLLVLAWRGCRVDVPLHRTPRPARAVPGIASAGAVTAHWLGVSPEAAYVHVYTSAGADFGGASLRLTQHGQTIAREDRRWPFEFIVPVGGDGEVAVQFSKLGGAAGEVLRLAAP